MAQFIQLTLQDGDQWNINVDAIAYFYGLKDSGTAVFLRGTTLHSVNVQEPPHQIQAMINQLNQ